MRLKITTREQALTSMCYKEFKPGIWLKPVGYSLFTYFEERGEWAVWFASAADGETLCWARKEVDPEKDAEQFLHALKYHENWNSRTFQTPSEFEVVDVSVALMGVT